MKTNFEILFPGENFPQPESRATVARIIRAARARSLGNIIRQGTRRIVRESGWIIRPQGVRQAPPPAFNCVRMSAGPVIGLDTITGRPIHASLWVNV